MLMMGVCLLLVVLLLMVVSTQLMAHMVFCWGNKWPSEGVVSVSVGKVVVVGAESVVHL